MKSLQVEVNVVRTFTIVGENYAECWESFKRELDLLHPDGRWEMPSKFDRGRTPNGLFMDEQLTEHVQLREFTQHHTIKRPASVEFYADNEECPGCDCADTIQFELREDGTGRLDPIGRCNNCGFIKVFCSVEDRDLEICKLCEHRLLCLETNGGDSK